MKPVDKIINKKGNYYIATYSAYASILENIVGTNGELKKLRIDGGGLKASKGTYKNRNLFKNYVPENKKTLHAKIILQENRKLLSLWTGNLRRNSIVNERNLFLTYKVGKADVTKVKNWFNKASKNHLLVDISGNTLKKIGCKNNEIWPEMQSRILDALNNEEMTSLYAFSPWGSTRFVNKMISLCGKRPNKGIQSISLYTRNTSNNELSWVDYKIKNESIDIKRYIAKESSRILPHYKCFFITQGTKKNEKLVWAYVGSANLTEAALFKKSNIEYAVFFNKIKSNSEIYKLFEELKSSRLYEERICKKNHKKIKRIDESEASEGIETGDNFQRRKDSKRLYEKFSIKKWQNILIESYKTGKHIAKKNLKELDISKCTVLSITPDFFDLEIILKRDLNPLLLSVKKVDEGDVYSNSDIDLMFDDLFKKKSTIPSINTKKRSTEVVATTNDTHINCRFPIYDFLSDKLYLKSKKEVLKKILSLSKDKDFLNPEMIKILKMWNGLMDQL